MEVRSWWHFCALLKTVLFCRAYETLQQCFCNSFSYKDCCVYLLTCRPFQQYLSSWLLTYKCIERRHFGDSWRPLRGLRMHTVKIAASVISQVTNSPWTVTLSSDDSCISKMTYKTSKLGRTDLVYWFTTSCHVTNMAVAALDLSYLEKSSSVGLCAQDYKFLHVAVKIV